MKIIFLDGTSVELNYEESVQMFFGYLWTEKSNHDEHWYSAKEKLKKIVKHIPATSY